MLKVFEKIKIILKWYILNKELIYQNQNENQIYVD